MTTRHRPEYPRPQFVRQEWLNLNGTWDFTFADGPEEEFTAETVVFDRQIEVPFCFQSKLSGIGETGYHDRVWYRREFEVPAEWEGQQVLLNFGAVDYRCRVYVNDRYIGNHTGGHTSFAFDITEALAGSFGAGKVHTLKVAVTDPSKDERIPRGKQYWQEASAAIWYTRTTGIWQTVWLEPVAKDAHIEDLRFTPDFDHGMIGIRYRLAGDPSGKRVKTVISYQGQVLVEEVQTLHDPHLKKSFYLFNYEADRSDFHGQGWTWSPETPNLYDVEVTLLDRDATGQEAVLDHVGSYFGLRKVHIQDGMVHLNNRPYYQKLVLDQGYWPDSLMTAPTDDDFVKDIRLAKEMGFNGCRKHQTVADPRFLYWADRMGFLVWGECAAPSVFSEEGAEALTAEWFEIIRRDYNHPAIVTWVPINESWGVPEIAVDRQQQHFSQAIYHTIHALDTTRPVISNDGWEMTETDISAIHSYIHGASDQPEMYQAFVEDLRTRESILGSEPNRRKLYCPGFSYQGEPFMLTECGGIGYDPNAEGWGYTRAESAEGFLKDYERIVKAIYHSEVLNGFCYTQLTDVEQEKNGLLTADRQPKVPTEQIAAINGQWHPMTIKKRGV